jgi:hypothetical protein
MSEEYYSASADATLYIGTATALAGETLPADGADTFTEVPLLGTITPPPKEQTAGSFYVLNDNNPRAVGGRAQLKECPGNLVVDHSEAVHNAMSADADIAGARKRNWRLVYPDGHTLSFKGFVYKWVETAFDAGQDATAHRADFTIRVDGAVTES